MQRIVALEGTAYDLRPRQVHAGWFLAQLRATDPEDPRSAPKAGVFGYGEGAAGLAAQVADDVRAWHRLGDADSTFEAYPKSTEGGWDDAGAVVLDKRHSRIRREHAYLFTHREAFDRAPAQPAVPGVPIHPRRVQ